MGTLAPYCPLGKVNGFGNCSLAERKAAAFPMCVYWCVLNSWLNHLFLPHSATNSRILWWCGMIFCGNTGNSPIFGLGDFHFWIRDIVHITRTHSGSGRMDWGCACLVKSWDANAKGEQNNTSNLSNFIKGNELKFPQTCVWNLDHVSVCLWNSGFNYTSVFALSSDCGDFGSPNSFQLVANTISRHNVNVEDNYKRSEYDRYPEIHSFWRNPYVTFHWKERPGIHTLAVFWNGIDPTNTWSTSTFTTPRIAKLSIKKKKLAVIDCTCF